MPDGFSPSFGVYLLDEQRAALAGLPLTARRGRFAGQAPPASLRVNRTLVHIRNPDYSRHLRVKSRERTLSNVRATLD